MSPELIAPEEFGSKKGRPTKTSDCYALGMVIYEIISGNLPFHEHADLAVFVKVLKGDRPTRRARFTNDLWKILESCWASEPNDRPSIEDVLQRLEAVSISSEAAFGVDEETEDYSGRYSGSSSLCVGFDCDANAASVPDLSCLSVGSFTHDTDVDMDQVIATTDVIPTLPPPLSPPTPLRVKAEPTPGHQVYDSILPQINPPGGSSAALTEGVAPMNSGSEITTGITNPTRKIVTRELVTKKAQKLKNVPSANGRVPGSWSLSEDIMDSMERKDVTEKTDAPATVGETYGTTNTPLWRRIALRLPSVSFVRCPVFFFRKTHR